MYRYCRSKCLIQNITYCTLNLVYLGNKPGWTLEKISVQNIVFTQNKTGKLAFTPQIGSGLYRYS